MTSPLEGLVVADFSRVLAGPSATVALADLGANVIKVEKPGTGDDTRSWGPPWTEHSTSYFESANRSKKSVELNFAVDEDLALCRELVRRADVLVENFRTGTLDRFGLGPKDALAANERLVYCSVTGFGSGAGASLPGYDFIVQAAGGLMSITGEAHGDPMKVGVAMVDVLAGKDAVIGILGALAARDRIGRGQHVQVNLFSSLLAGLVNQASASFATGLDPERIGNAHPSIVPYQTFRAQDGVIVVACGNDAQFRRLVGALGLESLVLDARFATNSGRVSAREELTALLQDVLQRKPAAHWERVLTEVGVPASLVGGISAAFAKAEELGLSPVTHVAGADIPQVRHPVWYSESTLAPPMPPPLLGQHNDAVRQWLTQQRE